MIDDILLPYSPQIIRTLLQSRVSVDTRFIKHDPKMSFNLFLRSNVSLNSDEARSYFGPDFLWSTLILKFCSVPVGKGNGQDSEINAQCTLSLTNWNIVLLKQAHGVEIKIAHKVDQAKEWIYKTYVALMCLIWFYFNPMLPYFDK